MSSSVEQIKSRLSIADVVQSYLKLQKAGMNFRALCPFHNEKTPSFFVSPSRESWHCFGCGKGGDIFSFVMEIEGVEFYDALKILAHRSGVELKPENMELIGQRSERARLVQLLQKAKKFYESELKENNDVISYLKERGLKGETAKAFEIGFAPDGWRNLYDFLKARNFTDSEMEKAGMIIGKSSTDGRKQSTYYDRFRSRIMFPLNNSSEQIVGFSGRIFTTETDLNTECPDEHGHSVFKMPAKYINTPQTILYDKSRILYGFDKARIEIRKKDFCVLVEGQMDVIMSHQAGFTNTIAVSGTALTIEHLRMIKRLTNNLVIAFDGDEAGFRASKRGIDLALSEGIEVKVAVVPFGKDPADAIKENPEVWARALNKAEHIIKFYLDFLSERKEIEETVLPYIVLLPSEIEKAHWIRETAKKLFIKEDSIWEELKKIKHVLRTEFRPQNAPKVEMSDKPRLKLLEERLSGFILWQKDSNDKELQEEMERIIKKYDWERLGREPDKTEKLVFGAELFYNEAENLKEELSKLALELEKEGIKNHLGEISENIRRLENSGEKDKLKDSLDKFYKLTKELSSLNVYDKKNKKTN